MRTLVSHRFSRSVLKGIIRSLSGTAGSFSNNKSDDDIKLPPEPTTCCMSGCANCVWIAYAEELLKLYEGNAEKVRGEVLEKIEDPSLKMFLSLELKFRIPGNN